MFEIKRMKIVHWFRWEPRSRVWKLVLFRVSLFPKCRLIPQISMCPCEWAGRLKYLATGLDWSFLCFWHQVNVRESGHLIYGLILQCRVCCREYQWYNKWYWRLCSCNFHLLGTILWTFGLKSKFRDRIKCNFATERQKVRTLFDSINLKNIKCL